MIRRAVAVEVLREFAAKEGIVFSVDKARIRTKHTEETKRKIGEASRNISEETKRTISAKLKGIKRSDETKRRMSEAQNKWRNK